MISIVKNKLFKQRERFKAYLTTYYVVVAAIITMTIKCLAATQHQGYDAGMYQTDAVSTTGL